MLPKPVAGLTQPSAEARLHQVNTTWPGQPVRWDALPNHPANWIAAGAQLGPVVRVAGRDRSAVRFHSQGSKPLLMKVTGPEPSPWSPLHSIAGPCGVVMVYIPKTSYPCAVAPDGRSRWI